MTRIGSFSKTALLLLLLAVISCSDDDNPTTPNPETGNIVINPSPDSIDASWQLTGPSGSLERGSGDQTLNKLPIGQYIISWKDVDGYITPPGGDNTLDANETITFSGTYFKTAVSGQISIDQIPDILPGAGWSLTGPEDFSEFGWGDKTFQDLTPGEYTIVWTPVNGFDTPDFETIALYGDSSIVFEGTYLEIGTGTISIDQTPDGLLGAGWSLSGPENVNGSGDLILRNMPAGTYSLTWNEVEGYIWLSNTLQTLTRDGEIRFSGTYVDPLGVDFVDLPNGQFMMGSPADELERLDDETLHGVTLTKSFQMSSTEITIGQYAALTQWAYDNGYCTVSRHWLIAGGLAIYDNMGGSTRYLTTVNEEGLFSFENGRFFFSEGAPYSPQMPMRTIWYGAAAYCDWLSLYVGFPWAYNHGTWICNDNDPYNAEGYRLPTEAEWEYACRGGTQAPFNTGNCLDSSSEAAFDGQNPYPGCPVGPTIGYVPVRHYPANSFGMYEMHGNAQEWCNDKKRIYYGDVVDPVGALNSATESRVVRGGRAAGSAANCRSAKRGAPHPAHVYDHGFRAVRSLP